MAKLSENQKLGVIVGVAVLLSGLGGAGVWWAKGLVEEKTESIAQMKTEITAAQAKIAKIPKLEDGVIILRENLYEYVKILPEQSELNEFTRITNQFRSQSGVMMTQLIPGKPKRSKNSPFERFSYKIEIQATLWQFLQFMSLFEDYERFVQIKDFTLNSGAGKNRGMLADGVIHKITMNVETFVYRASAKSQDVQIANYGAKAERLREEIFEARQTIATSGYKFDGERGRRDIFVDPRETSGSRPLGNLGPSPRDQRKIIERLRAKITDSDSVYRRLQDKTITIFDRYSLERRLREQIVALEREVEDTNSKGIISHPPLKMTWNREVVEPLARLKETALAQQPDGELDRWLPEAEMRNLFERMKGDLVAGDISGAIDRYDTVEERIRVHRADPRYPIYTKIEGLYIRAKLAEEFSHLDVKVSGVMVSDGGKSGIIVNGTVYEEGEYIDNNLLVKQVERDQIAFVYKGFTVVKTR